ncbi:MAG: hypothetical protein PF495_04140 [Spirochaetales bacterium]|jgi:hypothetical protein|nr:hypothetical protein [Spirochaetales bacterium]
MNILRIIPLIISSLLLASHFYRAELFPLVITSLLLPLLLTIRKSFSIRVIQLSLILGSLEWLRTLYFLASQRQEQHQPWLRLAVILGLVALFTGLSALPLTQIMRDRKK